MKHLRFSSCLKHRSAELSDPFSFDDKLQEICKINVKSIFFLLNWQKTRVITHTFMHDNAIVHMADNSMIQVCRIFHYRKVSRNLWPPRSSDMNQCEVYGHNPHRIDISKDNIITEIHKILYQELHGISRNIFRRHKAFTAVDDRHFNVKM